MLSKGRERIKSAVQGLTPTGFTGLLQRIRDYKAREQSSVDASTQRITQQRQFDAMHENCSPTQSRANSDYADAQVTHEYSCSRASQRNAGDVGNYISELAKEPDVPE